MKVIKMKNIKCKGLLLLIFFQLISANEKVVFLSQDVSNYYSKRGCTPNLLNPLKIKFKNLYSDNFIHYDLTKLRKNDIKPYYIFNKKYCKGIGDVLYANTFIMTQLKLVGNNEFGECNGD